MKDFVHAIQEPAVDNEPEMEGEGEAFNLGTQPIDNLMESNAWQNHELVERSRGSLTFKMIRKARAGRKLTKRIQLRIVDAVNARAGGQGTFKMGDLFNYVGR